MDETELNQIMFDLDYYFDHAQDDEENNIELVKPFIKKWSASFTMLSLAWIAKHLKDAAAITRFEFLEDEAAGDTFLRNVAIGRIFPAKSIIRAQGIFGITTLLEIVKNVEDEDICALAAFMLQTCDFLEPGQPGIKEIFYDAYSTREGTACKIVLASGLHREGANEAIMFYIENGYLGDPKIVDLLKMEIRKRYPQSMAQKDIEFIIIREMLFPESAGMNNKKFIQIMPGLMGVLALDIASDGLAFMNQGGAWDNWKRKRYDD